MPSETPQVTVVMPVYNALPYLDAAVESVLAQTHRDFRFAIYDDHSTDGSWERAREWAARDARIELVRGEARLGPSGSSNAAAALAQGEFVARMDADDVARPERLELQLKAFAQHPEAVLVGSTFTMIDGEGLTIRPATPGRISGSTPPFAHPGIMYRRADFEAVGGYRPGTDYFEDNDLYRRLAVRGALLVINRPLLALRFAGQNARLRDDPLEVLRRINRLYAQGSDEVPGGRISPMAFYSVAVLAIQTLERPRLLGLMLRHASFARPALALVVLANIALAEVSPRLARGLGQLFALLRGLRHGQHFVEGAVYRWDFPEAPGSDG